MSFSEPFNFGRKIKELKRVNKKSYADLTAGLKISRERIIALEEGEREPTDTERQRFAAFYNLPEEEFLPGAYTPSDTSPPNRIPPRPMPSNPMPSNYGNERIGNERIGNERFGNERMGNERPAMPAPMGNERRPMGQGGNYNPVGTRPGGNERRPMNQSNPAMSRGSNTGIRPANGTTQPPKEPRPPKEPKEPKENSGEPKPVMKYTAEQLGDIESAYLRKQRDLKVPLRFTFLNGKEYTGVVIDFTPFTVHILEEGTGEEIILRKLAMAYYRKADSSSDKEG